MTHTFTYYRMTEEKVSEVVSLPAYSRHDLDGCVIYRKLFCRTPNGYTTQMISIDDGGGEISFSEETFMGNNLHMNADYYLGKEQYKSSAEEWLAALNQAKNTLSFYEP